MTLKLIAEKLARDKKKFITSNGLKNYCEKLSLDYLVTVKYLLRNKYIARTFKGIFYVYSVEERKLGSSEMSFYEILKEALKIKGIKKWYFGLETALKFNNLTHESFATDFVITDSLFRAKTVPIMGRRVKFYKVVPKLLSFGIVKKKLPFSDAEKTALDLLYLKHYKISEFEEITERLSKKKLIKYVKNYPNKSLKKVKL